MGELTTKLTELVSDLKRHTAKQEADAADISESAGVKVHRLVQENMRATGRTSYAETMRVVLNANPELKEAFAREGR